MILRSPLNSADVLDCDQDVELLKQSLQALLVFSEEAIRLQIGCADYFNLDNVVDELNAAILPRSIEMAPIENSQ